jgi:hypothetical protein
MRVRDHVALSTAGAAVLYPWLGCDTVAAWAASILIDADHYVWFCLHERQVNPRAAVRFYNQAETPHHPATRVLHSPLVVLTMLVLGTRKRWALPVALGMMLHVAADAHHEASMAKARATALRRDEFTCQRCGSREARIVAHVWRQPRLLPSYRTDNLLSLCADCHVAAHLQGSRSGPAPARAFSSGRRAAR